jgi:hypothetical protein
MSDELKELLEKHGPKLFQELLAKNCEEHTCSEDSTGTRILVEKYKGISWDPHNNCYMHSGYNYTSCITIYTRKRKVIYVIPGKVIDQITIDFRQLTKLRVFL